jgi:hypothetical protein
MKDHNVMVFDAVDDNIAADRKTSQTGTQVFVAATAQLRMFGSRKRCSVIKATKRSATSMLPLSSAM